MVYARETESSGLHPSFRRVCVDQDQFQTVFEKRDRTMKITGVRGVDGGDRWSKIAYRVAIATKKFRYKFSIPSPLSHLHPFSAPLGFHPHSICWHSTWCAKSGPASNRNTLRKLEAWSMHVVRK